jgi:hypothetical protein
MGAPRTLSEDVRSATSRVVVMSSDWENMVVVVLVLVMTTWNMLVMEGFGV